MTIRSQTFAAHRLALLAAALGAVGISLIAAPGLAGALGAMLALLMLGVLRADLASFIIPDKLVGAGLILALANALITTGLSWRFALVEGVVPALLRALATAGALLALRQIYFFWRQREGIGLGDVKLAGVAGAWLASPLIPIAFELAALGALGAYLVRQRSRARALRPDQRVPFGAFLAASIWLCWLLQAVIDRWA